LVSNFPGNSLKLMPPDALILAQNAPKCVWRPGSARTRWGSLSAPPDPLAAKRGPTSKGRGRKGGEGKAGKSRGGEGRGGMDSPPPLREPSGSATVCDILEQWSLY